MIVLHHLSGDRLTEAVDHLVEQLEAVDRLHHVVDRDILPRDGAGLVDIAGPLLPVPGEPPNRSLIRRPARR